MKIITICMLCVFTCLAAEIADDSVLFQAMGDELNRSINLLQIENQVKPYYISYRVIDKEMVEISASFGSIISSDHNHTRDLYACVRVGNRNLDNSNFVCQARSSRLIGSDHTNIPLDDDYDALRCDLWLITDGTYKKALEVFSRKKASLQNQQVRDDVADFAATPRCVITEPSAHLSLDRSYWEQAIQSLSSIFKRFPRIHESKVTFTTSAANIYFLDTEENKSKCADFITALEIDVKTQSSGGDPLERNIGFYGCKPNDLPDLKDLEMQIAAIAETLSFEIPMTKEDDYSGPVIFTGQAAAELFFQVLGKGVSDVRTPLFENEVLAGQMKNKDMGMLANRYGRRVMPTFLSAIDDPTLTEWNGVPLVGHFTVDDEGVRAERVELVKDGKLHNLLMSRAPTKKISTSNGHARYHDEQYSARCIGMSSNLIVNSTEQKTLDGLKEMLIALCREYEIPYGIVITRLEPTKELTLRERYMRYYASMTGGGERSLLSSPAVAYKVSVDGGTADLIRGLDFASVTTRVLRDIVATGNTDYVYNFVFRDEEGNTYPVSVVTPALLIEEMDLVTNDVKSKKLPILSHPFFKK